MGIENRELSFELLTQVTVSPPSSPITVFFNGIMQRAAITRVQDAVTTYWKKQDNDIHNTVDRVVGECRGQSLEMGSALEAKMVRKKGREEEGREKRGREKRGGEEGKREKRGRGKRGGEREMCVVTLTLVCTCKRLYHHYFTCLFLLIRSSFCTVSYSFIHSSTLYTSSLYHPTSSFTFKHTFFRHTPDHLFKPISPGDALRDSST